MKDSMDRDDPTEFVFHLEPPQVQAVKEAADERFRFPIPLQRNGRFTGQLDALDLGKLHERDATTPYDLEVDDSFAAALIERLYRLGESTSNEAFCHTLGEEGPERQALLDQRCDMGKVAVELAEYVELQMQERVGNEFMMHLIVEDIPLL